MSKKTTTTKATKGKGTKATKKTTEPKGPGVIASIIELLQAATAKKPLSKSALLDKLVARFPDRTREAMHKTINCQVPFRLRKDKELEVHSNDEGYWLNK